MNSLNHFNADFVSSQDSMSKCQCSSLNNPYCLAIDALLTINVRLQKHTPYCHLILSCGTLSEMCLVHVVCRMKQT